MTVRIDLGREVRASIPSVLEYFMNVEELPHFHPEYINRLTKFSLDNAIKIETVDGDGKGSLTNIRCVEMGSGNTQIKLNSELHYGLIEKILNRSIHAITEKTLEEDIKNIERM